jgi:hypothetical protein
MLILLQRGWKPSVERRRTELAALCAGLHVPEVLFSAGVIGTGKEWKPS